MASPSLTLPSAGLARPSHAGRTGGWHQQQKRLLLRQPGSSASSPSLCSTGARLTAVPPIRATAVQSTPTSAPAVEQQTELEFPIENPETWSKAQRAMVDRTIDLEGLDVSPTRRAELVEEVRKGSEIGVFYIKNFGVDDATMNHIRRVTQRYFQLPLEEKLKNILNVKLNARAVGYSFKFSTASTPAETVHGPGYRELFRFRDTLGEIPNLWPASLPEFRVKHLDYMAKINRAVELVGGLMSEGLGLPASYIGDQYGSLLTSALLAHSPPQKVAAGGIPAPALPPHSDGNFFTFNASSGVRGVQYFLDGEWVTSPALLDAAIINLGDDSETMSNGQYHAPYHRVLTSSARNRVSILMSVELGEDEMVGPAAELGPARYRTRRCADNLEEMVRNYAASRKPVRSKAPLMLDADSHLDKTKNVYDVDGVDYLNGVPVTDWGEMLN